MFVSWLMLWDASRLTLRSTWWLTWRLTAKVDPPNPGFQLTPPCPSQRPSLGRTSRSSLSATCFSCRIWLVKVATNPLIPCLLSAVPPAIKFVCACDYIAHYIGHMVCTCDIGTTCYMLNHRVPIPKVFQFE